MTLYKEEAFLKAKGLLLTFSLRGDHESVMKKNSLQLLNRTVTNVVNNTVIRPYNFETR